MQPITYTPIGIIHTPFAEQKGTPIQPPGAAGVAGHVVRRPEDTDKLCVVVPVRSDPVPGIVPRMAGKTDRIAGAVQRRGHADFIVRGIVFRVLGASVYLRVNYLRNNEFVLRNTPKRVWGCHRCRCNSYDD